MMNKQILFREIYQQYGTIKRAKGPFLYTQKGVRLTDLYQEDGKAILGWGGNSAFTMMKNALDRGATGSYYTDYSYRLEKAVCELLDSSRIIFVFNQKENAIEVGNLFGKTVVYKPWDDSSVNYSLEESVIYIPTLPLAQDVYILAVMDSEKNQQIVDKNMVSLPNQIILSSPVEAGITRNIYDLIKAIQERQEKDWFIYDVYLNKYFTRKGPYLYSKLTKEKYEAFVKHCISLGIVLNPDFDKPSIVPFGAPNGVLRCLKNNPFNME